ncbi:MAG: DNA translocase FtsK 4TM domain-containing protein, partial [Verrucomicrobiota bacterium]
MRPRIGLALLGLGTLLFLALISYTPRDVPTWFPLHSFATPNRNTLNFIGPFGAIVACLCYSFFGAAAYLFPAMLLGYGGAKLLTPSLHLSRRWAWVAVFFVSAACLTH